MEIKFEEEESMLREERERRELAEAKKRAKK